jgi:isocitrate dehydrogenase
LEAAGATLDVEAIEIGEKVYLSGNTAGIEPKAWDSLRRTRVFYKAPITTPQGGGYKSLNVTTRKTLGLYANVRPVVSYHPFVDTKHPNMDVVIVRENEEDVYAGIEHRGTDEVVQCLKLLSRPGTERIIRYAFEYARRNNRKKVTCFTKDNIMKMTDGMFHKVFDQIAAEYPDIKAEHWIVDIGMAKVADAPEQFDVIVVPNLYGDILSDIAAEVAGSIGLAGSANIGEQCAMFEAVHGSAPDIAGRNIANPSGLLLAGVYMLVHIGMPEVAAKVHNAWLRTIEDGIHTGDVYKEGVSAKRVGTAEFADAVVERLGLLPRQIEPVAYGEYEPIQIAVSETRPAKKELVGVDVFLHHKDRDPNALGAAMERVTVNGVKLVMITNRGQKVYPNGAPETFCTDHWRVRFMGVDGAAVSHKQVLALLGAVEEAGFDFIKTEHLYTFDGQPGYSLGQGQ